MGQADLCLLRFRSSPHHFIVPLPSLLEPLPPLYYLFFSTTSSFPPPSPPQHTCRLRSGTCLCLWGPVFSSSYICGVCKSGNSSSSHINISSYPSTPSTTSRNTSTTTRAGRCTSTSPCPREALPDRPGTGQSRPSCWSRTWRGESRR